MRPTLQMLEPSLVGRIIDEAREVLAGLGVEVQDSEALELLADHGAEVDRRTRRARIPGTMVDRALATAPSSFGLFDVEGRQTHDLGGDRVAFTPGSSAIHVLDRGEARKPTTADYVRYARVMSGLGHIASQSTAFIPADVPEAVADSYRLFLSLLHCPKPVVTGAFRAASVALMTELQVAVRGSASALRDRPLTIFTCCPTTPLIWSETGARSLLACCRAGLPVEVVAMPLAGFTSPVTLVGTLAQHTAEVLSGVVIAQCAAPGTPVLFGGSPAIFDVRYESTPMGAVETQMMDCGLAAVGKQLNLPVQAYVALSDAKQVDAQAGLESAMGATLAVLAGVNSISGPGMLDFENCHSTEKLVLDNEICGMALRLIRGVVPRDDLPVRPLLDELLEEGHLLIAGHTRGHLHREIDFPGPVIDRAGRHRWIDEGRRSLEQRLDEEVERLEHLADPVVVGPEVETSLVELMTAAARGHGLETLPERH